MNNETRNFWRLEKRPTFDENRIFGVMNLSQFKKRIGKFYKFFLSREKRNLNNQEMVLFEDLERKNRRIFLKLINRGDEIEEGSRDEDLFRGMFLAYKFMMTALGADNRVLGLDYEG